MPDAVWSRAPANTIDNLLANCMPQRRNSLVIGKTRHSCIHNSFVVRSGGNCERPLPYPTAGGWPWPPSPGVAGAGASHSAPRPWPDTSFMRQGSWHPGADKARGSLVPHPLLCNIIALLSHQFAFHTSYFIHHVSYPIFHISYLISRIPCWLSGNWQKIRGPGHRSCKKQQGLTSSWPTAAEARGEKPDWPS